MLSAAGRRMWMRIRLTRGEGIIISGRSVGAMFNSGTSRRKTAAACGIVCSSVAGAAIEPATIKRIKITLKLRGIRQVLKKTDGEQWTEPPVVRLKANRRGPGTNPLRVHCASANGET